MDTNQSLLDKIAELKRQLASLERKPQKVVNRRSNNPRSRYYVTDYDKLTPVKGGYVHPDILEMYNQGGILQ